MDKRIPAIERGVNVTEDRYVTRDGLSLGLSHWDAASPFAVIVALHGVEDYAGAFDMPAPWWAARGITTYAYDQRGYGRSPNPHIWAGGEVMRRDLGDFVDAVSALHPGLPIYVLGQSMGGSVAMTAFASQTPPKADGLILVAPAVWGWTTLPRLYRVALSMAAHTVGWFAISDGKLEQAPSDNTELLEYRRRDPLVQKYVRTDEIYGLASLMDDAYLSAPRLGQKPLLFLYGGNDQIVPREPTEAVLSKLGPNATVKFYPAGYHMLLRDLDHEPRWADVVNWLVIQTQMRAKATRAAE